MVSVGHSGGCIESFHSWGHTRTPQPQRRAGAGSAQSNLVALREAARLAAHRKTRNLQSLLVATIALQGRTTAVQVFPHFHQICERFCRNSYHTSGSMGECPFRRAHGVWWSASQELCRQCHAPSTQVMEHPVAVETPSGGPAPSAATPTALGKRALAVHAAVEALWHHCGHVCAELHVDARLNLRRRLVGGRVRGRILLHAVDQQGDVATLVLLRKRGSVAAWCMSSAPTPKICLSRGSHISGFCSLAPVPRWFLLRPFCLSPTHPSGRSWLDLLIRISE